MDRVKKLGEDYPSVPVRSWLRRETYRVFDAQAKREKTTVDALLSRMADKAAGVIVQVHPEKVVAPAPVVPVTDPSKLKLRRSGVTEEQIVEIRRLNVEERLSDSKIAKRVGVSQATASRYRRAMGLESPTPKAVKR